MDFAFQQTGDVMGSLIVLIPLMKLVAVSFTFLYLSLSFELQIMHIFGSNPTVLDFSFIFLVL